MKKFYKVFSLTFLLTLFRMIFGFVIAKVIAIYAGPSGLAMLGQFQSLIAVFNGIVNSSVSTGVVRYTSKYHSEGYEKCAPWWRASLYFSFGLLSILIPVVLLFVDSLSFLIFESNEFSWLIIIAALVLPFNVFGTLLNSILNGQQDYRRFILLGILCIFLSSSLMITLIMIGNIKGALLSAALQNSIIGIVMFLSSLKRPWFKLKYWVGKVDKSHYKSISNYFVMGVTSALVVPVSMLLIRHDLVQNVGWDITGHWQAVWKISEVYLSVITIAFTTYFLPRLSVIVSIEKIKNEIFDTSKMLIPIVIVAAIFIYFFRDLLITLLFTESFRAARDLFLVQLAGDVFKVIGIILAYPMLSMQMTKRYIISEIVFSIMFVLLSFNLIQIYGVEGVNIAYLITYVIYTICMYINVKYFLSHKPINT
jgi:O-antigen/teichoic acid export membrane protein